MRSPVPLSVASPGVPQGDHAWSPRTLRLTTPLDDLAAQHGLLSGEIEAAIAGVLASNAFIGGPEVQAFEREFAAYLGCEYAVGLASGSDALRLGLQACGIGPGDEVITSAMSFIATVAAVLAVGATPVLVDPDPVTGLLEADAAAEAIGERTAALLPVHLYGQAVDLAAFKALAVRHDLALIEDACQAHGASRNGLVAGTVGDAAAFSFSPGKNLGALGDGGALTTSRAYIAERVSRMRDHGRLERYVHREVGENSRLDAIQAAVLRVKLRHLEAWNEARRGHAEAYDTAFDEQGIGHIRQAHGARSVFHRYVLLCDERDALAAALTELGIATAVHYPLALHRQPALAGRVRTLTPPVCAEAIAARCLSIPVFPELDKSRRRAIVDGIAAHRAVALKAC